MRNLISGLVIGLVVGVLLAVSVPPPSGSPSDDLSGRPGSGNEASPATWRMASVFPRDLSPYGPQMQHVLTTIAELSKNQVEIGFFGPGAVVPAAEVLDAVASGVVDAGFSSPAYWADTAPALQLFGGIPFGPDQTEFLAWFRFGGGEQIYDELYNGLGIHSVVCGVEPPAGGGWFKRPIETPDDLKSLKVAAAGLPGSVLRRLGATPSQVPPADIMVELKAADLDGAIFAVPTADRSLGLHQFMDHYYFPGWHKQSGLLELLVNLTRWNALSDAQRQVIEVACASNIAAGLARAEAGQFDALKSLVISGVTVAKWEEPVLAALRRSWLRVAAEQAANDRTFRRAWQSLNRFREDYSIWRELGYL